MTAATPAGRAATLETTGTVTVILTDPCDWQEPVTRAAGLAARSGRRLKVILADSGDLLTAASLDCVRLMASGGLLSDFDPAAARRLLRAQTVRLRQGIAELARRLKIEAELIEATAETASRVWAGSTALTVFGRRRGVLLVVHAGTAATLEVAASLAAERHQAVRLLTAAAGPGAEAAELIRRLLGPWLAAPAATLAADAPLALAGHERVATLVLDPAYVEARSLSPAALVREARRLLQENGAA